MLSKKMKQGHEKLPNHTNHLFKQQKDKIPKTENMNIDSNKIDQIKRK